MLKYRPVAVICLALTAGLAAGLFLHFFISLLLMALMWGLLMLIRPSRRRRFALTVAILAFGAGSLWGTLYAHFSVLPETAKGETAVFTAKVADLQDANGRLRAVIDVDDSESEYDGYSAYIYVTENYEVGDVLTVEATMRATGPSIRGIGIEYNAYGYTIKQDGLKATGVFYTAAKLRHGINKRIHAGFSKDAAGFYGALITGIRQGMSEETNALFARSGLSHVVAISGQHFSVIVMSLYTLLLFIIRRKRLCCGLCIALALAYTVLVGASPSVVRACIMCCAVFFSWMTLSGTDSFTVLCGALAVIVLFSPYSIASMGLQLSFLATAGILAIPELGPRFMKRGLIYRLAELLVTPIVTTLAATFFCLPVLLTSFDYISAVSPVANLAVNFLAAPALIAGIVGAALADVFPQVSLFTLVPEYIYKAITAVADFSVSLPYSTVSSHIPCIKLILIPTLWLILTVMLAEWRKALRSFAASTAAAVFIIVVCVGMYNASLGRNAMLSVNEDGGYILNANDKERILVDIAGKDGCWQGVLESGFTALDSYIVVKADELAEERLEKTLYYINIHTVYLPKAAADSGFGDACLKKAKRVIYYDNEGFEMQGGRIWIPQREGVGCSFILVTEHEGTVIETIGSDGRYGWWPTEAVDGLIVTRACAERNINDMLLPTHFESLYLYGDEESTFTRLLEEKAIGRRYYDKLTLRYGDDGIREVEE